MKGCVQGVWKMRTEEAVEIYERLCTGCLEDED